MWSKRSMGLSQEFWCWCEFWCDFRLDLQEEKKKWCAEWPYHCERHAVNLMFVFGLVLSEWTVPVHGRQRRYKDKVRLRQKIRIKIKNSSIQDSAVEWIPSEVMTCSPFELNATMTFNHGLNAWSLFLGHVQMTTISLTPHPIRDYCNLLPVNTNIHGVEH